MIFPLGMMLGTSAMWHLMDSSVPKELELLLGSSKKSASITLWPWADRHWKGLAGTWNGGLESLDLSGLAWFTSTVGYTFFIHGWHAWDAGFGDTKNKGVKRWVGYKWWSRVVSRGIPVALEISRRFWQQSWQLADLREVSLLDISAVVLIQNTWWSQPNLNSLTDYLMMKEDLIFCILYFKYH